MRLVISNPHIQPFSHTVASKILRRRSIDKYRYFIDEIIKNQIYQTAFLVDGTRSSFNAIGIKFKVLPRFFTYLELLVWMAIHQINPWRHPVYFSVKKLQPKNDVIFNFAKSTIDGIKAEQDDLPFHYYHGLNAIHLTHYFTGTRAIGSYLEKIPHKILVAENDVSTNKFYRHFLPPDHVLTLPFALKPRYQRQQIDFNQRLNKCFAVGTLQKLDGQEYREVFGDTPLQPMRQTLYEKQEELRNLFDTYITKLDTAAPVNFILLKDAWWQRWLKQTLPAFILEKILRGHQTDHFSFDIVAKYNEYRMFISPEENVGLPSINWVEGMACGCAFVGVDDPMYTALGLRPGEHYIAYRENELPDLINKIQYYQQHEAELKTIVERGWQFVTEEFQPRKVAARLWQNLEMTLRD